MDALNPVPMELKPSTASSFSTPILIRTAVFLFASTTPGLGVLGVILTCLSFLSLLLAMRGPDKGALTLLSVFLLLIIPITIYDLFVSLDRGFETLSFVGIPLFLIAGFVFSQSTNNFSFIDVFEEAVFYLALLSFPLFVVFVLNPGIAYNLPEYEFRESLNHTAILLNIQMNPDPVIRNAGFASEPGFYQILINTALYARLRRLGAPDGRCLFYLIVVLSTLSTAGIAVSFFLMMLKFDIKYRLLVFVLIMVFFSSAQEFLISQYDSKIANDNVFGPRFLPSVNAFNMFLDRPLGIGAVEYTNIYQRLDLGSWDSYTQIAMRYGIPGLLGFAALMLSLLRRHPVLAGMFALSFITSPIWFLPALSAFYFRNGDQHVEAGAS